MEKESCVLLRIWIFQTMKNARNPLMTLLHLAGVMIAEAQAQIRMIQLQLNIVGKH